MSLLGRAIRGAERRAATSTLAAPSSELVEALTGGTTYTGRAVSTDNSLQLVPVYSAVSLLAGAVGSLPMMVYRRLENGRERATNHWLWRLLHDQPNSAMGADEMWELVMGHLLLWGNAFLLKIADPVYPVGELWPVRPDRMQVGVENGERFWVLDGKDRLSARDVLHIRGLGTDGVVGLSPIQQARQMLASGMEMEEFTGRFWGSSAMPSGVLTHPNVFKNPVAAKRIKDDFLTATAGARRGSLVVLEEGMKFERVGLPMADAQFIETAKFNLTQIALLFRVPPKMLAAATGDSLTYTSSEWESLDFVRWSLRRWLVRIEGSLLRDPDLFIQGRRFYPEFLVEAMLRGTSQERAQFYTAALNADTGWMRRDEVRDLENLEPEGAAPAPTAPADQPVLTDADLVALTEGS